MELNERVIECIKLLKENEYITAKKLSQLLNTSVRTIHGIMQDEKAFNDFGIKIISKIGKGYTICITDQEKYQKIHSQYNSENRIAQIILLLIEVSDYIKTEDLADKIYVSRATVDRLLVKIKDIIKDYDLKIVARQKYGIKIEGSEMSKRLCYSHFSLSNDSSLYNQQLLAVHEILLNTFEHYSYNISDASFNNLTFHIMIALERIKHNNYIEDDLEIDTNQYVKEYCIAKDIISKLEDKFAIQCPEGEMKDIMIHVVGKQSINDENVVSNELIQDVDNIFEIIYSSMNIDFRDDMELRTMLILHMQPMMTRLKYRLKQQNPLLENIKREMSQGYEIALIAKKYIEDKMHIYVNDDEVGYMALYFSLAIERKKKSLPVKKKVLVVCTTGRGTSKILQFKLMKRYHLKEEDIKLTSLLSLNNIDESLYSCIYSTVPINVKLNIPVVVLDSALGDIDFDYQSKINSINNNHFKLNENLVFFQQDFKSKEEILSFMCDKIIKIYNLDNTFKEQVFYREEMSSTEVGNRVVLPHPFHYDGEIIISILILKKPICWKNTMVKFVFLVALPSQETTRSKEINNAISMIICDPNILNDIENNQNYEYIQKCLEDQI